MNFNSIFIKHVEKMTPSMISSEYKFLPLCSELGSRKTRHFEQKFFFYVFMLKVSAIIFII